MSTSNSTPISTARVPSIRGIFTRVLTNIRDLHSLFSGVVSPGSVEALACARSRTRSVCAIMLGYISRASDKDCAIFRCIISCDCDRLQS